jgi:type VI secretion system protein VasG
MLEIDRKLVTRLRETGVHIDVPDNDTAFLRGVPVNAACFSKPSTNVLVKRPREGMPFVTGVDEDLRYVGANPALARLFAGGIQQAGWRVLSLGGEAGGTFDQTVQRVLSVLGFDGSEPALGVAMPVPAAAGEKGLLRSLGVALTKKAAAPDAEPTVGRGEVIEEVVSCLLRWGQTRLPIIAGECGVGKTNLLLGVARRLSECRPTLEMVSVDLGAVFAGSLWEAERENLLMTLGREAAASSDLVVAVEHLDLALAEVGRGAIILSQNLDAGARLVGTTLPALLPAFDRVPLTRRLHVVELAEPTAVEALAVLKEISGSIAKHHQVDIGESAIHTAVRAAQSLPGCLPAKAIALLDAAASRAALAGAAVVGSDDIYYAAGHPGNVA